MQDTLMVFIPVSFVEENTACTGLIAFTKPICTRMATMLFKEIENRCDVASTNRLKRECQDWWVV